MSLPETLDETYSRILKDVPSKHRHHTIRILQFLTFSERPLRIEEAVDAIAVDVASRPYFDQNNRMPIPEEILKYCSSLVTVATRTIEPVPVRRVCRTLLRDEYDEFGSNLKDSDEEVGAVKELQLAHFSVKEYLMSGRLEESFRNHLSERAARSSIVEVCVGYLLEMDATLSPREVQRRNPMARYSAQYWPAHARLARRIGERGEALVWELFKCLAYEVSWSLYDHDLEWELIPSQPTPPALYYASNARLAWLVRKLLGQGDDVDAARPGVDGAALWVASMRGHRDIVQLLLDHGANVNLRSSRHQRTPLAMASSKGHREIVQLLLDHGANVNPSRSNSYSALVEAAKKGHREIVQLLLDRGANVNAGDHHFINRRTVLSGAAAGGHREIVQLLLDRGTDVNGDKGKALMWASAGGHHEIVQLLLDRGADVNGDHGSALVRASAGGHREVLRLLLGHGVEVNTTFGDSAVFLRAHGGGHALSEASARGHREIVQLLLDHGAAINGDGGKALVQASTEGHREMVQLLLDRGADVNGDGGGALVQASARGYREIVQLLLDRGAVSKDGRS